MQYEFTKIHDRLYRLGPKEEERIMPKKPNNLPEIYERIGLNIRRLRTSHAMTQEDLSLSVGIGRTSITNIEYGRQRLQIDTLALIAEAMGVDVVEFFQPASMADVPVEVLLNGRPMLVSKELADQIRRQVPE